MADRLATVLDYLGDDARWDALEGALNQRTIRVYDLSCQRIRIDATTATSYLRVTADGLVQFGPSKDHRPDLPQIKINLAVLDPMGMPVTTAVVPGERADDPLYLPAIRRVQASVGRHGLTYIGDCKMGSLATRAAIVASGDFYLCPLAGVHVPEAVMEAMLTPVWQGQQTLTRVERPAVEESSEKPALIAEGFECRERLKAEVAGRLITWEARRLVIRSVTYAQAQERALHARLDKALIRINALNHRRRGKKRVADPTELRTVCQQILEHAAVADLVDVQILTERTERPVRRYGDRPARVKRDERVMVQTVINQAAVTARIQRLGWRVYVTPHTQAELSLKEAVFAYREQFVIEQPFGRLKHKPLSLSPMYLETESRIPGLVRVLSLGLRVLTLFEGVVRRTLQHQGTTLAGMYAGNPKRATARPTTELMLHAFNDLTLTVIQQRGQLIRHLSPLSPVQRQILDLLGLSPDIYERLTEHCSNSS